ATGRWFQRPSDFHNLVVIQVEAGHGVIALRVFGLFFDGNSLSLTIKLHHSVALWIRHLVTEYDRSFPEFLKGAPKRVGAVEDVVSQDQDDRVLSKERLGDQESLGNSSRVRLGSKLNRNTPMGTGFK